MTIERGAFLNQGNIGSTNTAALEEELKRRQVIQDLANKRKTSEEYLTKRVKEAQDPEVLRNRKLDLVSGLQEQARSNDPVVAAKANADLDKLTASEGDLSGGGVDGGKYAAASKLTSMAGDQGGGMGVATGALSGAATGATLSGGSPVGAGIGAAVGIAGTLMSQSAARNKAAAAAKSKAFENIAKIEEDSETKRQTAMKGMVDSLRAAFIGISK